LDILLLLLILYSNYSERVKIQINVFFVRVNRILVGLEVRVVFWDILDILLLLLILNLTQYSTVAKGLKFKLTCFLLGLVGVT
jgi:hypothetical protein